MLEELEIFNFALLGHARLGFAQGLNVLTGETGAGKSILLDALVYLLGGPAPSDGGPCRVQGSFRVAAASAAGRWLQEQGCCETDQDEVLVSREVGPSGRSAARVNGRLVTQANLRELGDLLVDLNGQHRHYSLLRPSRHLQLLDRAAGPEHLARVEEHRELHERVQQGARQLESLRLQERDRNRELEWLGHELEEIEKADPRPGEECELEQESRRLGAASELSAGAAGARALMTQDGGALEQLGRCQRLLQGMLRHDATLEGLHGRLGEAACLLQDAASELEGYADNLEADPGRLERLQERLELLRNLKRKYGATLDEVLEYAGRARVRLAELEQRDQEAAGLEQSLATMRLERDRAARELSRTRAAAARDLQRQVELELEGLGMPGTRFEARQEAAPEPGPWGCDRVEFFLAPNAGVGPQPLARIASGGELSRLMLALIAVFSRYEAVPTLVFDEVDAGLGGRAAEAVAGKLRELKGRCQVLCVTHLAVLAATADRHFRLRKEVLSGRTHVFAEPLLSGEREQELARMLSGNASPRVALMHARELLQTPPARPPAPRRRKPSFASAEQPALCLRSASSA